MYRIQLCWTRTISKQQKPSLVSSGTSNTAQQAGSLRMQQKIPTSNVPAKEKPRFNDDGRLRREAREPLTVLERKINTLINN